jgi:hypothetical protein
MPPRSCHELPSLCSFFSGCCNLEVKAKQTLSLGESPTVPDGLELEFPWRWDFEFGNQDSGVTILRSGVHGQS